MIRSTPCDAQAVHYPVQIPYSSFGAYSENFIGAFSFTCNQAILSTQEKMMTGFYGEQKFGLKELSFYSGAISFPAMSGAFGLQTNYSGFADYNESRIGIAFGKKLSDLVGIGVQFDYNLFHVTGYGNTSSINAQAGLILHPSEKITIGFHVYNPFGSSIGKNLGERLPTIIRFGFGYEASQQACIHAEIIKEENIPLYINAGLQYAFAKQFFAGIGIETLSASPFGYAGWCRKDFRIDLSVRYHLQLGFTPAIVFVFELKNKKQAQSGLAL